MGYVVPTYSGPLPATNYLKQLLSGAVLALNGDDVPIQDVVIHQCEIKGQFVKTSLPWLNEIRIRKPGCSGNTKHLHTCHRYISITKNGKDVLLFIQFVPDSCTPINCNWAEDEQDCTNTQSEEKVIDFINPEANPPYFHRILREPLFYTDNVYLAFRPRIISVPFGGAPGWRRRFRHR